MMEWNPLLAHVTPSQALTALKSELKAYTDKDDLFERAFRPNETVGLWWAAVQKKMFRKVLGVNIGFKKWIRFVTNFKFGNTGSCYQAVFYCCGFYGGQAYNVCGNVDKQR